MRDAPFFPSGARSGAKSKDAHERTRSLVLRLRSPCDAGVEHERPPLSTNGRWGLNYNKFQREAQLIARLRHPTIVQAMDLGVSKMPNAEVAPWMALEWIEGQTLRDWLRARPGGPLPAPAALAILRPIFEALAAAHEEGIAHRDIKPSNIMVTESKRGRQVRLMDFGIAKLMEDGEEVGQPDQRTISEFPSYSARYAAPEQALGRKTGPWTDVHAMGLMLTEILVGGSAYRAKNPQELLAATLETTRPSPEQHGVDVGAWEPVIARSLAFNPAERFTNAAEFLAALEHALPTSSLGAGEMELEPALRGERTPMAGYRAVDASARAPTAPYREPDVADDATTTARETPPTARLDVDALAATDAPDERTVADPGSRSVAEVNTAREAASVAITTGSGPSDRNARDRGSRVGIITALVATMIATVSAVSWFIVKRSRSEPVAVVAPGAEPRAAVPTAPAPTLAPRRPIGSDGVVPLAAAPVASAVAPVVATLNADAGGAVRVGDERPHAHGSAARPRAGDTGRQGNARQTAPAPTTSGSIHMD